MCLEKVIKKLNCAPCATFTEKKNVAINIKICEMQIKIRDEEFKRNKKRYGRN